MRIESLSHHGLASPTDLRGAVIGYLQQNHTMTIATDGPEGLWASTVFYVNTGFELYFQSRITTRHAKNLSARPRVAGTIGGDADGWRAIKGAQFEGNARVVGDYAERTRVLQAFFLRFPHMDTLWGLERSGVHVLLGDPAHRVFAVRPDRVLYQDHEHAERRWELTGPALAG